MSYLITDKEPKMLFQYFEDICAIPRSSGNEKGISDFLVSFAKAHNLEYYQDEIYNVIIKKNASADCKNMQAVILQGHTDMVCEKNSNTVHNFSTDGLKLRLCGENLMATGTTLGADNGIAVAIMLAILSDEEIMHPALECVFTVQEETGLTGAKKLDTSKLNGRTMINLDSEDEGIATISCAGGIRARFSRKIAWETGGDFALNITISGLNGGHSGTDIYKERANANKLMARILFAVNEQTEIRLCDLNGGSKDNAIPREADAKISLNSEESLNKAIEIINSEALNISNEYAQTDCGIIINVTPVKAQQAMSREVSKQIIDCCCLAPNGVLNRNVNAGGFIVRSINMGVIKTTDESLVITFSPRSSVASLQNQTKSQLKLLSSIFGFEFNVDSEYPGWNYAPNSKIRDIFKKCYKEQSGKELICEAIHAGLECGLFCEKLDNLDAIAVGPSISDCHTPEESLNILSCERTYKLITNVLAQLCR